MRPPRKRPQKTTGARLIVVPEITRASHIAETHETFRPVISDSDEQLSLVTRASPHDDRHLREMLSHFDHLRMQNPSSHEARMQHLDDLAELESLIERREKLRHRWGIIVPHYRHQGVIVDPLVAQIRWRLPDYDLPHAANQYVRENTRMVTIDRLRARFWDRQGEIEEWVSQKAQQDVYAQPTEQGWRFCFLRYDDIGAFDAWLSEEKKHRLVFPGGFRRDRIIRWAHANIGGQWFDATKPERFGGLDMPPKEVVLVVRRVEDAVLTRLRWSDPDNDEEDEAA